MSWGVLGSAYGLFMLGYELLVDTGEWDGFGIVVGLLVLAVTLPLAISFFVLLRLLRRPDPASGVVGTAAAVAALVVTMALGPGFLWAVPGTGVALLVVAVVASRVSAPAPSAR